MLASNQTLHLHSSSIGNFGVSLLVPHLKRSQIEYLNLGGNHIGTQIIRELFESLPDTLTELDLGNNDIGSLGAMAITDLLPATKLARLYLHNNQIDATGIQVLFKAYISSPTLRNLRVQTNVLDSSAKEALRLLLVDVTQAAGGLERSVEELKLSE